MLFYIGTANRKCPAEMDVRHFLLDFLVGKVLPPRASARVSADTSFSWRCKIKLSAFCFNR